MGAVGKNYIFVEKITSGPSGGVPAEFPNIHRVSDDILDGSAFKRIAAMGADSAGIERAGDGDVSLTGGEALKNLTDYGSFFWDRD